MNRVSEEDLFIAFRLAYYGSNKSLAPDLENFRRAYTAILPMLTAQADELNVPNFDTDSGKVLDSRPMPDFMNKYIDAGDSACKDPDGCLTELAVLQRFWRSHRPTKVGQAP